MEWMRGGRYEVGKVAGCYAVQVSDTTMSIEEMWLGTKKTQSQKMLKSAVRRAWVPGVRLLGRIRKNNKNTDIYEC